MTLRKKPMEMPQDGVSYRRTKLSTILLALMQGAACGCFYSAIGSVSYAANLGFGIPVLLVGTLMTLARLFDGITDPLISMLIDKCNTKFGKIRLFSILGWIIMALSMKLLYDWGAGKGHSALLFMAIYLLYYVGYTFMNMTTMLISPVMTNDPKQRPMVGVCSTAYTYIINIVLSVVTMMVLLPAAGGRYTMELLAKISTFTVLLSGAFLLLSLIGLSKIDKPENFIATSDAQKSRVKWRDMLNLLKDNKGLQCYILAATSDKLAMTISGQTVIGTLLFGVVIGNMQLSAILNIIAIIPILACAAISGKHSGKNGSQKSIAFWSRIAIVVNVLLIAFLLLTSGRPVAQSMPSLILFVVLTMAMNGLRIAVSIPTGSMLADVVDYEAYRSGKYMPGAVAGVHSFVDKAVSAIGAVAATFFITLIGYKDVMPQPTDPKTMPVVILVCCVYYGLPILGWICSLIAMKKTPITKEKMVEVQKTIAERKKTEESNSKKLTDEVEAVDEQEKEATLGIR